MTNTIIFSVRHLGEQVLTTITDIGTLINHNPEIHGDCPIISGTEVTVRRIAIWYKQGYSAEEIADQISHLNLNPSLCSSSLLPC
ncbi:DUF433 domain-containing protein [Nostoc sp. MG11]|uniref:DUF433 domain-containing protein n=1 Tax=Nostoc sp. MG11 TaxID=2721166 RepID=UPI0029FF334B|nr:DUF433 domain-containing protein [Nostoc sp. MG11]